MKLNYNRGITVLELLEKGLSEIVLMPRTMIVSKMIDNQYKTNENNITHSLSKRLQFYLCLKDNRREIPYSHFGEVPVTVEEVIKLFIDDLNKAALRLYECKKLNSKKTVELFFETQSIIKLEECDYKIIEEVMAAELANKENNCKEMANMYDLFAGLKEIDREGWKKWNVQKLRVESDMDHTGSAMGIATTMYMLFPEYRKLDIARVLMMLQYHDLGELIIGDIPVGMQPKNKSLIERRAIEDLLFNSKLKDKILKLWDEFEARKTPEAKFAYYCDKIDCSLQAKFYDEKSLVDLFKQEGNPYINNEKIKKLLEEEDSWSNMWIQSDIDRCDFDDNFKNLAYYVKKRGLK